MAFIEFFKEDDSGNWQEQLEEIRLRYPGTYKDYAKEKPVRPATPARIKKEIEDRKIAKYEQAEAAYDGWKRLHPEGVIFTSEQEAHGGALKKALDRAESAVLEPVDFVDCAKSGVATFEDDFLMAMRGGEGWWSWTIFGRAASAAGQRPQLRRRDAAVFSTPVDCYGEL